ncbi:metallohydrolase [Aliikangiella marina]|uniref:Metallohydrolase n=1 Tax=Aliikangiella marina TaxID=1712262 RepID=A0A545T6P2_9GAMM|nr:MBL fold metallo-hydrolase [Aliikangiella marina]TQV72855.1 metallohydrolase [Aliikangiella marina]
MKKQILVISLAMILISCSTVMIHEQQSPTGNYQNNHILHPNKSFWAFARMRLFGDDEWADHESEAADVVVQPIDDGQLRAQSSAPRVTWIGHSTFLIQYKGVNVLTDPIFSQRASPVSFAGPKRLVDLPIEIAQLPAIDLVVISHNHYDHLDEETITELGNQPQYALPDGVSNWFLANAINASNITDFKWWQSKRYSANLTVTATPSQHWSSRSLYDRNQTHWASWLIEIDDFTFWFAGDTGYNQFDFKEIGNKSPPIDLALIPIGAYAPRHFMKPYHVNEEEALQIHRDIKAKTSIGMHWGTFSLTAEPLLAPPTNLASLVEESGNRDDFRTINIGQSIELTTPHANVVNATISAK